MNKISTLEEIYECEKEEENEIYEEEKEYYCFLKVICVEIYG